MQLTVSRGKLDAIIKDLLQQPAAPPEDPPQEDVAGDPGDAE